MNEDARTQETVDMLCAGVEKLQLQTAARIKSMQRRTTAFALIGGALVIACYFALSSVTSLTRQLDANTVVQIARVKVQEHLPSARRVYQEHLEREAPRLVRQALRALIDLLPRARSFLVADLNKKLDLINEEFEARAIMSMADAVRASKAQIETIYPGNSDRENLELLVSAISGDFGTIVTASNHELYPHYSREISRIRFELATLRDTPEEMLTEEQRIKRDIIVTLMHLIMRDATAEGGSVRFAVPFSSK